ncbi:MAG: class I SAM-dependent methyltransferase [Pseudomonadota bacterium]
MRKVLGIPETNSEDYVSRMVELSRKYNKKSRINDSLTGSELLTKSKIIEAVETQNLINSDSTVVIWGCWYGSILIPYFSKRVKRVIGIDKDDEAIRFAKNKLFVEHKNVELITDDVFATHRSVYQDVNLIVNAACDYMPAMRQWPWFAHGALEIDTDYPKGSADSDPEKKRVFNSPKFSSKCSFVFQSSDMAGIEGRTNCVKSMDEFKAQMPARASFLTQDEVLTDKGTVFTLVGNFVKTGG